ncbi:Citrinin biosynthesis transcriptional activator ctnR, partial [Pseudocercospora fuligena]
VPTALTQALVVENAVATPSMYSPTDSVPGDDGSSPSPGLARRATIGDPVYDNQAIVRQRRKAAVVACERCRRRETADAAWKIRCDGLQPCATCARFGVRCARPEERRERSNSNAEHAALADRVRQLEARLAAVGRSDESTPRNEGLETLPGHRQPPPALHLDTSFNIPDTSRSFSFDGMQDDFFMPDDMLNPSLSVPTISITGPNGSVPSSPLAYSPSPSLFSGTSRASSPDPFSATSMDFGAGSSPSMLGPLSNTFIRTPPLSQWADVYARNEMLQMPESVGHRGISRRSSVSSFGGLGEGLCAMNLDLPMSPGADWAVQDPFDVRESSSQMMLPDPIPEKDQAEALADHVFETRGMRLPFDRTAFKLCLEAVFDGALVGSGVTAAQSALATYTPYSIRVARAFVFLTLAIGLKSYAAVGRSSTGMDSCYSMAIQQMQTLEFWVDNGARDVASLLSILCEVSTQ